jgi:hypothetical protein
MSLHHVTVDPRGDFMSTFEKYEHYETRGDKPGHPFRGNGSSGGGSSPTRHNTPGVDKPGGGKVSANPATMIDVNMATNNGGIGSADHVGDTLMKSGMQYSQAKAVADTINGDKKAAALIRHTDNDIGDRLLNNGYKYSAAKIVVDKIASVRKAAYADSLAKAAKTPRALSRSQAAKAGLVDYGKGK